MNNLDLLKYPVGRFEMPKKISDEDVQQYIRILGDFPAGLAETVENFDDEKFSTPYRENGWTVWQVVNHVIDSHSRAYEMFRYGLQQNNLAIEPQRGEKLPNLGADQNDTVKKALQTIYSVHESWTSDLKALSEDELDLIFFYPDAGREMPLGEFLAIFAWHSRHHLAHIKSLKDTMGW